MTSIIEAGTLGVPGQTPGDQGPVEPVGWDLGTVALGGENRYTIDEELLENSPFTVTLNWFRDRTYDPGTDTTTDIGQADLNLRFIDIGTDTVISESISLYNTSEHLSFMIPYTAQFGIEVVYAGNTFGSMTETEYGIAWSGIAIPEPGAFALLLLSGLGLSAWRRRA